MHIRNVRAFHTLLSSTPLTVRPMPALRIKWASAGQRQDPRTAYAGARATGGEGSGGKRGERGEEGPGVAVVIPVRARVSSHLRRRVRPDRCSHDVYSISGRRGVSCIYVADNALRVRRNACLACHFTLPPSSHARTLHVHLLLPTRPPDGPPALSLHAANLSPQLSRSLTLHHRLFGLSSASLESNTLCPTNLHTHRAHAVRSHFDTLSHLLRLLSIST